jgi:tetratricopeptide (TPR) repeat protein
MMEKDLHMFRNHSRQVCTLAVVIPVFFTVLTAVGCNRDPNVRKQKYLESGKRYEKDGKLKEAAIQFSNALKVDKNFGDAHYEMAKTYLKMGSFKASYGELMRTVELNPANLQARNDLGTMLLAGNAVDRAEQQANAVLAADPNNADGYALRSSIAARKGDRAGALENIQHALKIDPNRAAFHTTLALISTTDPQSGNAAEEELQKAITLDTKDSHARIVMAALLEKKGDLSGAEQQYIAAIQQQPADIQPRAGLAGLYMRKGDKAKAEQTARKAVEDIPDSDRASELLKDFYVRTGQPDPAETTFAELTAKYPKSFPIKLSYAEILGAKKEYAKLSPVLDQLTKTSANFPQVQLLRSAMLLNDGKSNEAITLLQSATKNAPENAQLQLALGRVGLIKGDLNLAESSFNAAQKLSPQDPSVQLGLVEVANRRGDANLLAQVAEKTIAMHPDYDQAYFWRGSAEVNLKQYDKAEADLQTAVTKNPNNAAAYVLLGQIRLRQGHIPEGAAMMEKALEKDPDSTAALGQLVSIDMFQKHPEKALARVQQQVAKSPKNPGLYNMLASIQLGTKDFNGAQASAKQAMALNPVDEHSVQLYAQALDGSGNKDGAIQVWQTWLNTHPRDAAAISLIALLDEEKGDQNKAMEGYKKALSIDPSQGLAANNLAYLMVENGQNVDVALAYAQTARRAMANNPNSADTLAWVYYHKGTYFSARDLLEDALKQDPDNASIHYHLGMTYDKLGRKTDAITHLKKAVALAPNTQTNKDATAALAKLG